MKRLALFGALTLLILSGTGQICPARAQALSQFDSAGKDYMNLGAEFMRDIGSSLRRSDLFLAGADKLQLAEQRSGSYLPNEEPLLFRALFGTNEVVGTQDIYAIKQNDHLMISLADFITAANLAIKVNIKQGTAEGWFLNEVQTFVLDAQKKQVLVAGKLQRVNPGDIETSEGELLVTSEALERWFNLSLDYDLSQLNLLVKSAEPFPAELAFLRSQKLTNRSSGEQKTTLPIQEPEYGYASLPYVDTDLTFNGAKARGGRRTHAEQWSSILSGDYAGFNTKGYVSGTSLEPYLNSARITMGKEDPRGNLLGPLHATSYQFGDINATQTNLIGSSAQERGVAATNIPINRSTTKTYTNISGDAHPGWDVELYRNESYIDIRHVEVNGRYDFGKVDLILGNNDFKLLFYGPQGERKEEHKIVNVDSKTLDNGVGFYDMSLTQKGRDVYERITPDGPGVGTPHLAARYERGIKNFGTLTAGLSTSNDSGQYRTFTELGLATDIYGTLYNFAYGLDTASAAHVEQVTARRNFGAQSASVAYAKISQGYNVSSPTGGSATKDMWSASLAGPIFQQALFFKNLNYNAGASYINNYNGSSSVSYNGSLTTRINSILFTAGAQYGISESPGSGEDPGSGAESFTTTYNMRSNGFGGSWRLGAQYQVLPEKKFTGFDADYTRSLADNLDSTTTLTYDPESNLKTVAVSLNWMTPKAIISPRIQYDNNHNIEGSVNVHFGLVADPDLSTVRMTGDYVTDNGGVAARIFLDNNGNGIFDDGDKLLQDADLIAIQGQQSASSNEKGVAFIPNLPKNNFTDITVGAGASEATYGVSLFKGVSILPHPGAVTKLDFPIVNSGEIDGNAQGFDDSGKAASARGLSLALITPGGRVHKTAISESDGYWSMSTVEPGIYYLAAIADEGNPGYFLPRLVEYKADGTTLFGQDVKLTRGYTTNFRFTAENSPPDGSNHARVIRPSDIASQRIELEVGSFHSRLAMTLAWYKIKLTNKIPGGLTLAMPMAGMPVEEKTGLSSLILKPNTIASIEQGASACQSLGELHLNQCTVNMITTYRGLQDEKIKPYKAPSVEIAAKAEETVAEKISFVAEPDTAVAPNAMAGDHSVSVPQADKSVITTVKDTKPATTATLSPALAADLADYVSVNPGLNKALLKDKTVLLNLGSYNSRALMTVIWFKIRTRYAGLIGDAQLLVQPTDSNASAQTGKYTLRASLPVFNVEDANNRCRLLTAQAQICTVEVLPSGLQASR